MNITSTQFQSFQKPVAQPTANSTFGPEIDPIGDVKDAFVNGIQETARIGGQTTLGALPGYGAYKLFGDAIGSSWSGREDHKNIALGGAVLNAAGAVGLAVAGGQALMGASPTLALQISGGLFAGAGLTSGYMAYDR